MGVSGLLPLLKSIQKNTTLKAYAGQTLGVDAFGWLHRGAVACALQLALEKPTIVYLSFIVSKVRMLQDFGITPYLVFDGDALPSKAGTNAKRKAERATAKELGLSLYRSGKTSQAQQELAKAVAITPQMTHKVISALRKLNVQVLVAPYEADAQLVYLEQQGIIDGVLSEDSDLLVFGVKKLITKLDQYGSCIEIDRADFCRNKDISFAGWSDSMFRRMAILSGCDYLSNVNKVGLKTAHDLVKKHKELPKIVKAMAFNGKFNIPASYSSDFCDAERTFLYHRVFCPKAGRLVFLHELPPDIREEDMPFLGPDVDSETAIAVACGDLDPRTKKAYTLTTGPEPSMLKENRRQTVAGSSELKTKRSIDNFFKPSRQPLAELDPNSLTPSPSQQRLLERNRNASWEPRPVHSAPQLRRSVTDVPFLSHSDLGTSMLVPQPDRSAYLSRAGTLSSYKPAKRIRLCSESDEASPSKDVKHSRFFSPTSTDQSPLASKKIRERARKSHFDVFSDDSIEGAMYELEQQVMQSHESELSYPSLPALVDDDNPTEEAVTVVPQSSPVKAQAREINSQSSHGTVELNELTIDRDKSGGLAGIDLGNASEAFVDLLEFHVSKLNEETRSRTSKVDRTFSGLSPEKQTAALESLHKPAGEDQSADVHASMNDSDEEVLGAEEITSPPGRKRQIFRNLAKTFALQSSTIQTRAFKSLGKTQRSKLPPMTNVSLSTITKTTRGSEDSLAIVRSSDNEEEVSDVGSEEQRPARVLDIKSFQYTA